MELPFPFEMVAEREAAAQEYLSRLKKVGRKDLRPFVESLYNNYASHKAYGFEPYLFAGIYTPYTTERRTLSINTFNCTTVIPEIFLSLHCVGLQPQIVEFSDFRDVHKAEDKEKPLAEGHYSLIFELAGRKYLFDPFWEVFNPILRQEEGKLVLGAHYGRKRMVREYGQMNEYTPQQFHDMMMRLRDPAESLEMLVAGQKILTPSHIHEATAEVMVYYTDEKNRLTTRLYLDSDWITDKVIHFHQDLDEQGKVQSKQFELSYAKDHTWSGLVNGQTVARFSQGEREYLHRMYRTLTCPKGKRNPRNKRFGAMWAEGSNLEQKAELLTFAEQLLGRLTEEERKVIWPKVLARTLYECSSPQRKFLYTQKERDQVIIDCVNLQNSSFLEGLDVAHQRQLARMGITKVGSYTQGLLKKRREKLFEEADKALDSQGFGWSRKRFRYHYDQVLDIVLYSKSEVKELTPEEMEHRVKESNFDFRVGYLALIRGFDFFIEGTLKKLLTLQGHMPDLCSRVKARREMLREDQIEEEE